MMLIRRKAAVMRIQTEVKYRSLGSMVIRVTLAVYGGVYRGEPTMGVSASLQLQPPACCASQTLLGHAEPSSPSSSLCVCPDGRISDRSLLSPLTAPP